MPKSFFFFNDVDGKKAFWHSSAHVLAQAIQHLYPKVKLTIGPAIENGFYYDIDFCDNVVSEKDFYRNENKSIFKQRFLSGSFNLNNIWQLSDRKFPK